MRTEILDIIIHLQVRDDPATQSCYIYLTYEVGCAEVTVFLLRLTVHKL